MIILNGWFQDKKAELKTSATADCVRIEPDTEFFVKDGKIYLSIDDVGQLDEFGKIYNRLQDET